MNLMVVVAAQQDAVVDRGFALIPVPPVDVVDLAPAGGLGAPVELAAAVSSDDGAALFAGVEADGASEVDGDVVGGHHDAGELGVAQDAGDFAERDRGSVLEGRGGHRLR